MTAGCAKVTWAPPRDDGGSPITNYLLEMKQTRDYQWTEVNTDFTISQPEYEVTGLKEETDYIFRVSAINKAGQGKPSEPSDIAKFGKSISRYECTFSLYSLHREFNVRCNVWFSSFPVVPIEIVIPLKDQETSKIPTTITFECEISKPNLDVIWLKAGEPIEKSRKYKTDSKGTNYRLVITEVSTDDDDEYTVRVKKTDIESKACLIVKGNFYNNSFENISRSY